MDLQALRRPLEVDLELVRAASEKRRFPELKRVA
jgi:hypothetical protein